MHNSYWWCPECKREVDGAQVTFEENHESCGTRVQLCNDAGKLHPKYVEELERQVETLRDLVGDTKHCACLIDQKDAKFMQRCAYHESLERQVGEAWEVIRILEWQKTGSNFAECSICGGTPEWLRERGVIINTQAGAFWGHKKNCRSKRFLADTGPKENK